MPDESPPKSRPHPAKMPSIEMHGIEMPDTGIAPAPMVGTAARDPALKTPRWRGYVSPGKAERERRADQGLTIIRAGSRVAYAELGSLSNFTFLTGASHPDELVVRAAELGHRAVGIADVNTLAGVVRGHVAAEKLGLRYVVGCRLVLADGTRLQVYPTDVASYGRLCRLLTVGKMRCPDGPATRRGGKTLPGGCDLGLADLAMHADGLLGVYLPRHDKHDDQRLARLVPIFGVRNLSVAAVVGYGEEDCSSVRRAADLAEMGRIPLLATNGVEYHIPERRMLHDTLACIRHGCTLESAGFRLAQNGERHLKPPEEMARLFSDLGKRGRHAIARSIELAERTADFSLAKLKYQYPSEVVPAGRSAMSHLEKLARAGLRRRFPEGPPDHVRKQFEHELVLIEELNIPHYFLTVEDLVRWSRKQGILCQGRGAAANSIVCYSLDVTDADPRQINTLFERFVSRERQEPPDIDIDFEHERREEAIQYLYRKYGRDRAALTANVITYRGRMATREVGKALGFGPDALDRLAKSVDWWHGSSVDPDILHALKLNPDAPVVGHLLKLTTQLRGFPRHLSQHPGGFVLTETPLCELCPIEHAAMPDRTRIEWDKDDIDALGFIKVDVLGLGMLTALAKSYDLLRTHRGIELSIADTPDDDSETYAMIQNADTVGVFQIESRAQMSMLPRLRPACYYDLVIEVAIVRPGPIQGGMVHPYLRRRDGIEPVEYPNPDVEKILGKTLGVPLFQEQAMHMAVVCAGFTPDEADGLRRAVTGFRRFGDIDDYERAIIDGMTARGYDRAYAERCFKQIQGFSTYGFPESHASSFALLVYASCYVKWHHPSVFLCAMLNSQPLGFYGPMQLVQDAQRHGVTVLPVCVLRSSWDCTLEPCPGSSEGFAVRLGMRQVKGLRQNDAEKIVKQRRGCTTLRGLWHATGCSARGMKLLATADAFAGMLIDRKTATWQAGKLRDDDAPLFDKIEDDTTPTLPITPPLRDTVRDYATTSLTLRDHPIAFLRDMLNERGAVNAAELGDQTRFTKGTPVTVAGLCLCRQRPGSAKSITFMTLEDETGCSNLVVFPNVFAQEQRVARHSTAILAHGHIDRDTNTGGKVVHVIVNRFESLDPHLADLQQVSRNFR